METVRNAATAASKVIWGDQHTSTTTQANETAGQEPISGQQGKGTAEHPFDQGNAENTVDPPSTSKPSTDSIAFSNTESTTAAPNPEPIPDIKTPDTTMNPDNVAAGGAPKPLENTDKTGISNEPIDTPKTSDIAPSSASSNPGAAPSSGAAPEQKQQGADRPTEDPTDAEMEEILKNKDPNDHSGEPMKMHDGSEKTVPSTQEERRDSKIGMPGGQEHGSEPKGTGDQWVKTSGMAADGGDFDATKPGAGREAERLLEEKGIHKTNPNKAAEGPMTTSSSSEEKHKVPLSEKIKTKLHIGHKDK